MYVNANELERAWRNQTDGSAEAPGDASPGSADHPPLLLDKDALAKMLGVGKRKLHDVLAQEWMPRGIELGPRCIRWSRDEVARALSQRAPRRAAASEPEVLEQARARRRQEASS